jgi:tetratricopeptide (TPR) repeat protein
MKKICILLFFPSLLVIGQKKKPIDSLLEVHKTTTEDSIKLKTSNKLTSYYMYRDIKKAKLFAYEQLELSRKINDLQAEIKALNHYSTIYSRLSKYDSAQYYIEKTLELAVSTDNLAQQSISKHSWVIMEIDRGNFDKAMHLNTQNIAFNQEIADTLGLAMSYETESSILTEKGQYLLALHSVMKSLEVYENLQDSIRIADVYNKIAIIENSLENFDSSIKSSKKALKIYEDYEDIEYQSVILNILGISYKFKQEFETAKDYFTRSMEISYPNGYQSVYLVSLAHFADVYLETDDNEKAKKTIDEGISISAELGSQRMVSYFKMRLATYFKKIGSYTNGLVLLDSIIKKFPNDEEYLISAYRIKSEIQKEQNEFERALESYERFKSMEDSTSKRTNATRINELRIIYETEQREAEIALQNEEINTLNAQNKADGLQKGLYAGGMASALAVSGLLFFSFRQRIKKNRLAREKQEAIYQKEIEHKQKELASQTLHLVQKNIFIQELMENLENIKNSPEKFKMEFRRIVMLLKKENASDKDWEVFKTYFAEVHNDFDQKLKTLFTDISEKEIRLAAFLRMNMTTKEIAATLNVLPDSILKSKYRLKKKLNLDKDTDLTSFLNRL